MRRTHVRRAHGSALLASVLFALAAVLASFRVRRPDVVIATSPQFFAGLAGMAGSRRPRPVARPVRAGGTGLGGQVEPPRYPPLGFPPGLGT